MTPGDVALALACVARLEFRLNASGRWFADMNEKCARQ